MLAAKNFVMLGAAGFIAPRHLKAMKETNSRLLAAYDRFDSVGVMDSYFPEADFFLELERFDRHVDKLKRNGVKLDYTTICTPNYLHDAHIRFGLKHGSDVICEKPLVLNPHNALALQDAEEETGKRVFTILQLRLHPAIIALKKRVEESSGDKKFDFDLAYITARGNWYYSSWKGDTTKSGGVATNIGIHFFDMLQWIFGDVQQNTVHLHTHDRAAGFLEFKKARVRWFLSINADTLPDEVKQQGKKTYRSITMGDEQIEFSEGFTDLHTHSYQEIFAGNGFGISTTLPSLHIAHQIRTQQPVGLQGDFHPLAKLPLSKHPFQQ